MVRQQRGRGFEAPERGASPADGGVRRGALATAVTGSLVAGLMVTSAACSAETVVVDDRPGAHGHAGKPGESGFGGPGRPGEPGADAGPGALGASGERETTTGRGELVRAADVLVRAESSRVRTTMETASGGTRVAIRGSGRYDFARRMGRLRVVLPKDAMGEVEHEPITELLASGALFMRNRGAGVPAGKWVRVDVSGASDGNLVTGGATDPLAAAELLRAARRVTLVGEERLDGAVVRHYRGTADIGAAARASSSSGVREALAAAAKGFAEDTVAFDAYVDERGRLRKVRHRFTVSKGWGDGSGRQDVVSTVVSTTELYDFGIEVSVRLPAPADIYTGTVGPRRG
ncbi:hypothetical protein LRS74_17965 [Streptomyces sp. LX-29]|uniref:hypothetical protein n=1 Tax=Streptomyces sp. LX-29 TaxID=2900152 RepID=UPI00240E51A0|nr:hypothetical protein [Streptomyces sp. LX-29]WFB08716.1 hypothetical protein LRS74_17965 [Streptomyces sp. LX-29]